MMAVDVPDLDLEDVPALEARLAQLDAEVARERSLIRDLEATRLSLSLPLRSTGAQVANGILLGSALGICLAVGLTFLVLVVGF